MRPSHQIEAGATAHRRLLLALERLTDEEAARPSLLPGWSRGHVITHLARHADSHVWLFEGARRGDVRQQYPTPGMREADIEAGSARSADELRDDLTMACERLEEAWRSLDDSLWERQALATGGTRPVAELVFRRLREVEVHHVDLALGYAASEWLAVYVDGELTRRLRGLPDRADHHALVAWLVGRGAAPDLKPW